MAFSEDFNSYANGSSIATLNGGSGFGAAWSETTPGTFRTSNATTYEGAEAATCTISTGDNAERQLGADITTTTIVYVAMRRSINNLGSMRLNMRNTTDNDAVSVVLNAAGNIVLGSTTPVTVASYVANTWYVIRVTIDPSGSGSYTGAVSTDAFGSAGTFGTESSSKAFQNSGNLRFILIDTPSATISTDTWDYISTTNPFVAAVTKNNLTLLGAG